MKKILIFMLIMIPLFGCKTIYSDNPDIVAYYANGFVRDKELKVLYTYRNNRVFNKEGKVVYRYSNSFVLDKNNRIIYKCSNGFVLKWEKWW
ncbi:MAG: hypothetical protein LBL58_07685 [Tannerellaceae bacterium]|nr:hypothetical protein [Tannerellaceae bacterium]